MKVLLLGANGQLASDLLSILTCRNAKVTPLRHKELEVCDSAQVDQAVAAFRPDYVINTTAFHKLEECEKNAERSFAVNTLAVGELSKACERHGAALVHFSTDYVFGGDRARTAPYAEIDKVAPLNVYGASKAGGELMVPFNTGNYFLLRVCGLYGTAGSSGKGSNFVEGMLKKAAAGDSIKVVEDQVLTPTATLVLAEAVVKLMETRAYGLYHVTCEGQCSWYEFARAIFELSALKVDLSPVKTSEFPSPVQRPGYSVLSKQKLNELGIAMPHWREGLERYLCFRKQFQGARPTATIAIRDVQEK
jgi:dTDP-4-dehydrorhamnose reductase